MTAARMARWTAVVIAIAAVIDPEFQREQPVRATVAVLASPGASADADRLAASLDDAFDVTRGLDPSADATVLAGDTVPDGAADVSHPVIVVPKPAPGPLRIDRVSAPDRVSVRSAGTVRATIDVPSGGAPVTVTLEYDGARVDVVTLEEAGRHDVALGFLPIRTGATRMRVVADAGDDLRPAAVDLALAVDDTRWRVLFHDARPSWMSTFVRRALADDARFNVVARVATSGQVAIARGSAPTTLAGWSRFDDFDVIVVGAPEALAPAEIAALDRFARERGGTVVLPLDRVVAGAHDRLLRIARWDSVASPASLTVQPAGGTAAFASAEVAWPAALPSGAEVLATAAAPDATVPAVWRLAAGAGAVVTSGALDAWRFRADGPGFATFWRQVVADAAARAMPPLAVAPAAVVAAPGERLALTATVRQAALATDRDAVARVQATLDDGERSRPLPAVPLGPAGLIEVPLIAPARPGAYVVRVTDGESVADATVLVVPDPARPNPDESALADTWARSRGGRTLDVGDRLPATLAGVIAPPRAQAPARPMRSPWWIVPFALLLGGEWWWRRRTGLP